jgi:serine/threonine protein kinase
MTTNLDSLDFLSPPRAADEIGRLGSYRILKVLGKGGMGVVFLAEDPQLQRTVALKAMLPEVANKASARERFLREARATAKIEHDHIVTIFQVGEERGVPFLAMQLLKGMTLEDFLRKKQPKTGLPLPVEQILKLGREIAKGLAAAHDKGLIHRDIKPANIWLDATAAGRVKILDFGLAHAAEGDARRLTQVGQIIGTAAFMAPEQARGDKIDGRADLFSLGCILYRLCTGRLPWYRGDATETLVAIALEDPAPVQELNPDIPAKLAKLVMKLIAKKADDRPASAKAVAELLQAIDREQLGSANKAVLPVATAVPAPAAPPGGTWHDPTQATRMLVRPALLQTKSRRRIWLIAGAVAGSSVAAVVAALLLLPTSSGTPKKDVAVNRQLEPRTKDPSQPRDAVPADAPKQIVNTINMKLALIPAGKFLMGASAEDIAAWKNAPFKGFAGQADFWVKEATPQHEVRITRSFYLGVYPVTQGQYERIMGRNPSANKESPDHPVEMVYWHDAMEFCKRLSDLPEEKRAGRTYRLPTEAEWEYACRAGTTTTFYCGMTLSSRQANIHGEHPFGGAAEKGPTVGKTVKVGSYPPNQFGLYDMHGNVWQWCLDGQRTYTARPVDDPRGPETPGSPRSMRGGAWREGAVPAACRKFRDTAGYHGNYLGLRVLCECTP